MGIYCCLFSEVNEDDNSFQHLNNSCTLTDEYYVCLSNGTTNTTNIGVT